MPIRARKDITVYKIVYLNPLTNQYETPWREFPVFLNSTLTAEEKDVMLPERRKDGFGCLMFNANIIREGFIHCYTLLGAAKLRLSNSRQFVVKCTIKKGTLYYRSKSLFEICAKSIEVHDIVVLCDDV